MASNSVSMAIRSTLTTSKATINLSILEAYLQQCRSLRQFNQILSQMIFTGFIKDTYAASRLHKFSTDLSFVSLYNSRQIFDLLVNPNAFTWNNMMRAYLDNNSAQDVIILYKLMQFSHLSPDSYTFPLVIQACDSLFSGKQVHGHVMRMGFQADVYVNNTLINMYACFNDIDCARQVFDESPVRDSVSWNSILAGYIQMGAAREAKLVFELMPERNIIASNSMIMLFGRHGLMTEARRFFNEMREKDMVSWSVLISSLEQNGMYLEALHMFREMIISGSCIDEIVIVSVLSACANLVAMEQGRSIHGLALKMGIDSYVNLQNACIYMYAAFGHMGAAKEIFSSSYQLDLISWNSMISGYAKCGLIDSARALFDSMPEKDVVSWSAMISGYVQARQFSVALTLFQEMQQGDMRPDEAILVSVISACTHLEAFDEGKSIHDYHIRKSCLRINPILGTSLIDMHMKCGCMKNALEVFHGMEEKGVSTWNAVILGLGTHGLADRSLEMFIEMKRHGVAPNEITFLGVLSACRHMGLVDEARHHFQSMANEHNIQPNVKHYGCMVDLLGRAGMLKEAEELILSMPVAPDEATWGALLAACENYGDRERGERVGRKLIELHPHHDGFHVEMSNMLASNGQWDDALRIRRKMTEGGVVKTPGSSFG
ncbi:hypothetical protein Dimus_008927 [Dionaea muscipula]